MVSQPTVHLRAAPVVADQQAKPAAVAAAAAAVAVCGTASEEAAAAAAAAKAATAPNTSYNTMSNEDDNLVVGDDNVEPISSYFFGVSVGGIGPICNSTWIHRAACAGGHGCYTDSIGPRVPPLPVLHQPYGSASSLHGVTANHTADECLAYRHGMPPPLSSSRGNAILNYLKN